MSLRRHIFARFRMKLPLSKRNYFIFLILVWIYTLIWIFVIVRIWHYWHVSVWYKVVVTFFMICVRPSLNVLTDSYRQYRKDWDKHSDKSNKEEG